MIKKIQLERKNNRTKKREYTCGVERISASCLQSIEWRSTKYIFPEARFTHIGRAEISGRRLGELAPLPGDLATPLGELMPPVLGCS